MKYLRQSFAIIVLLCPYSFLWAQWGLLPGAVIEENELGIANYSQGYITAVGIGIFPENVSSNVQGKANAIRAAKVDAMRNLAEMVYGVRINSETTVRMGVVESDVIKSGVNVILKGASQVGEVRFLDDSSVEVTMGISMSAILSIVLEGPSQSTQVERPREIKLEGDGESRDDQTLSAFREGEPVTGIIIDGRGMHVKPSMSPRILTQNADVLYGRGSYPADFAVTQGVVGYHRDPNIAMKDRRVAGNPMLIKAIGVSGKLSTDMVISSRDALVIASANKINDFLGNCRVMFILD